MTVADALRLGLVSICSYMQGKTVIDDGKVVHMSQEMFDYLSTTQEDPVDVEVIGLRGQTKLPNLSEIHTRFRRL